MRNKLLREVLNRRIISKEIVQQLPGTCAVQSRQQKIALYRRIHPRAVILRAIIQQQQSSGILHRIDQPGDEDITRRIDPVEVIH
jgi:hypothetical protein